jgi:hypothetical protein
VDDKSGVCPQEHPAFQLLDDEAGRHTFALLNEEIQITLLASFLVDACYRLTECTALYHYAGTFSDARGATPSALREPLAMQALWRGDLGRLERMTGEGELPPTVTGWMALCRGQKDAALGAYRLLVSQHRKATRKRKLHLPPLLAMMAALTLLANHEPAYTSTLRNWPTMPSRRGSAVAGSCCYRMRQRLPADSGTAWCWMKRRPSRTRRPNGRAP